MKHQMLLKNHCLLKFPYLGKRFFAVGVAFLKCKLKKNHNYCIIYTACCRTIFYRSGGFEAVFVTSCGNQIIQAWVIVRFLSLELISIPEICSLAIFLSDTMFLFIFEFYPGGSDRFEWKHAKNADFSKYFNPRRVLQIVFG